MSDEFRHRTSVEVRFRDLDAFGHVNNAVITSYVEHGRIRYLHDVLGFQPVGDMPMILASITVDYTSPVLYGERIDVDTRVDWIGNRSLAMTHQLTAGDGREVARSSGVLVAYDYAAARSMQIADDWRAKLERHEGRTLTRMPVEA